MMISGRRYAWMVVLTGIMACLAGVAVAAQAPVAPAAVTAPAPAAPSVQSSAPAAVMESTEAVVKLPEGTVAIVNGEQISEKEWVETLKRVYGQQVLSVMVNHVLVRQAAAKRGIKLTDAEVQAAFDKSVAQAGGMDALLQKLDEVGQTLQDYRELLKTEALLRKLVEGTVTATDGDLMSAYQEQYGPRADVQVIVVATQPEADQAITEAKSGVDFSLLAQRRSTDGYTLRNHAFLPGPLSKGFFPKPFGNVVITQQMADAIFGLQPGEITKAMPAQGGFYIFKLVALSPGKDVKYETVKDQVKADFIEVKTSAQADQYMQKLAESADVRTK
jgi:foldase protein PrsA